MFVDDKTFPIIISFFAVRGNSSWLKMLGYSHYFFNGDANDPSVQDKIKANFIDLMTSSSLIPPLFCSAHPQCTKDNIKTYAGALP